MRIRLVLPMLLVMVVGLTACNTGSDTTDDSASTPVPTETVLPTQAPAKVASISGTVSLSGPVTQGSTLLMLQREVGDLAYAEFDRTAAVDGTEWSFDKAVSGVVYEITASLQVDEEDVATGNVVTTTAPSPGEEIFINTDLNLAAPSVIPRLVSCGDADGAGGYNATLEYARIDDAQGYYYEVGTSSGGNDVDKGVIKQSENLTSAAEAAVYVKGDSEHYTRYAYTTCADCDVYDRQNWSSFSPTLGFKCPQ